MTSSKGGLFMGIDQEQKKVVTNTDNPLIEIKNLSVEFQSSRGNVKAVNNISLTLHVS